MEYMLFKGTFRPEVGRPDGDSVRFKPDDSSPLIRLPRRSRRRGPDIKGDGTINLRYEGIDTLETWYRGYNQGELADEVTKKHVEILNCSSRNDKIRGYILTRLIELYGRPVVFAFVDDANVDDHTRVKLDVHQVRDSVNFQLIQSGFAYPCFYSTLACNLREAIRDAVSRARSSESGLWSRDLTQKGVGWNDLDSIEIGPIFPKLWRRLIDYVEDEDFRGDVQTLDTFIEYLSLQEEKVRVSQSLSTLDKIVRFDGEILKMDHAPEDLVFI